MNIILICIFIYTLIIYSSSTTISKNEIVVGKISSIAQIHYGSLQFSFIPEKTHQKIWLNWFNPPNIHLHSGDSWKLHIKYHASQKNWLLADSYYLEGSVQMDFQNQLMKRRKLTQEIINHYRENIYSALKQTLKNNVVLGFMSALTVGIRNDITESQWSDLRSTGTNHLMAIAGLHIGFMAFIFYKIMNLFWRRIEILMLLLPAQEASLLASLAGALIYSALSGFSLPTQRAVIMLSVYLITTLLRNKISILESYFFAVMSVLALSPLSFLSATFWLSFGAVGLLIYGYSGRMKENKKSLFHHWILAQWIMSLGLIPFGLLFFHQLTMTSLIANCLAIPFVGLVILPLCFLGIFFHGCWNLAAFLLSYFWSIIHFLATLPSTQWDGQISFFEFVSILLGVCLLLAPRGFPHRVIGVVGFLPLILKVFEQIVH